MVHSSRCDSRWRNANLHLRDLLATSRSRTVVGRQGCSLPRQAGRSLPHSCHRGFIPVAHRFQRPFRLKCDHAVMSQLKICRLLIGAVIAIAMLVTSVTGTAQQQAAADTGTRQRGVMLMNRIGPSTSELYVANADGTGERKLFAGVEASTTTRRIRRTASGSSSRRSATASARPTSIARVRMGPRSSG